MQNKINKSNLILFISFMIFSCCMTYGQTNTVDLVILRAPYSDDISDLNVGEIAKYYGLNPRNIEVNKDSVPYEQLKDQNGNWVKSIAINTKTLAYLSKESIASLRNLMDSCGVNIFVSCTYDLQDMKYQDALTTLATTIIKKIEWIGPYGDWLFSETIPYPAQDLRGLIIPSQGNGGVFAFDSDENTSKVLKVNSSDWKTVYQVTKCGQGYLFLNGAVQNIDYRKCRLDVIQTTSNFPKYFPIAYFLKYIYNEKCWHNNHIYANFTLDDPYFVNPYGHLDYFKLLEEMARHNFHTTLAYIPKFYNSQQDASVIDLFRKYPERYSIVQHGNNHDGYEFLCYTKEQLDLLNNLQNNAWLNETYRPLIIHEKNIVEGKTKLKDLEKQMGIQFGNVMIFPQGISMSPTFELLKKYNFAATVNNQYVPYLTLPSDSIREFHNNFGEFIMDYGDFAVGSRLSADLLNEENYYKIKIRTFMDLPLLLYSHEDYFKEGMNRFSFLADYINNFWSKVEWNSLYEIVKRMYYEKLEEDGSYSVKFFQNELVFKNETNSPRVYHFIKDEVQPSSIVSLLVGGDSYPYQINEGELTFDLPIIPDETKSIQIVYSSGNKNFTVFGKDVLWEEFSTLKIKVHNNGKDGGVCPVKMLLSGINGNISQIKTTDWIDPDSSGIVQFEVPWNYRNNSYVEITLDPYNIIYEEDNNNKSVSLGISSIIENAYNSISEDEVLQNYPNPFNLDTKIRYKLKKDAFVSIQVYNCLGERVNSLINKIESRGFHELNFEAKNLPSGAYFYRFKTNEKDIIRKMFLLK